MIDFKKIAAILISVGLIGGFMIWAKPIIVPLAFGTLFALLSLPVLRFYENKGLPNWLSIPFTFLSIVIPFAAMLLFFAFQIKGLSNELGDVSDSFSEKFITLTHRAENILGIESNSIEEYLTQNISNFSKSAMEWIGAGVSQFGFISATIVLIIVYTALLLTYRKPLKNFILAQFPENAKDIGANVLSKIQQVVQEYSYGLLLVMIILGVLNSLGLWAIGIDRPAYWGFLAAVLAIIPFLGTLLGMILPALYAFIFMDSLLMPVLIIAYFTAVQQIEDNLIKPNVVGNAVDLNPLASLFGIIAGGFVWSVAGLVLALPFMASLKVIFSHINVLKPLAKLMSVDIKSDSKVFKKTYNKRNYRLLNFFRKK